MLKVNNSKLVTDKTFSPIMKVDLEIDMELYQDHTVLHGIEETYSVLGKMLLAGIVDKKDK